MNCEKFVLIFPLVWMLSLFFIMPAGAQNKVVVIPLMEDATGPPAPVPKTGLRKCFREGGTEITCAGTGQDGDIQAGVAWPNPRFVDHGNGTVTDKLTGLIWLKNGNCPSFFSGDGTGHNQRKWQFALDACNALASGHCGLIDNSLAGEWRLPNASELNSLIDRGLYDPALPASCLFAIETALSPYWSATTSAFASDGAWVVDFAFGFVNVSNKSSAYYVRCVR